MSVKQANSQALAKITGTDSKGNHEDHVPVKITHSCDAPEAQESSSADVQRRLSSANTLERPGEKFPREPLVITVEGLSVSRIR